MFRIYKQNLEHKNYYKSQIRIKGMFRKETICSNIFTAYVISMIVFKFNNPLLIYVDYAMAIMLVTTLISMSVKTSREFNTLINGYQPEDINYSNEKIKTSRKVLISIILIIFSILMWISISYLSSIIRYNFSLKVFSLMIISISIYLIMKMFNQRVLTMHE
ncbi:hypothetical protein CE143_01460 [Photorhabdus luminescens]|uniref:DUF3278 domain-containing protein n=1 Tax=Photorhabdus akhurstii TaxID=171438 RepID=A0ABX8LQS6_9GAMM|nr:hypothetical protein B0X70_01460 [Photorhabdus akhurstii]UJD73783.1 hypothetical protein CE143_01460 [Photorhabdus luminescens]